MRHARRPLFLAVALLLGCAVPAAAQDPAGPPPAPAADAPKPAPIAEERPVDLALCLDTSNSMDGLIDAAKRRLWDVVNELARLSPRPRLRVALLSYGNNGYPQAEGWVRTDAPFTEDLDFISEKLFALGTNGGNELVARVVDTSIERLAWSTDPKALRICVVAGNESADQDRQIAYADACAKAAKKSVIVNAVYCGDATDAIAPSWRDVAKLGEGEFAAIDHNRQAPVCATPYDELLASLSAAINKTYLPFGHGGVAACENQTRQDENALSLGSGVAASRAGTKASSVYRNGSWDLVDACRDKSVDLGKLAADELPEAMRKLTAEERAKYVEEMAVKRAEIQKQIGELNRKREEFIAAEAKKAGLAADSGLDGALLRAIRAQAERKGFKVRAR